MTQFFANKNNITHIAKHLIKTINTEDEYCIIVDKDRARTLKQLRTAYALLNEFYISGMHSYDSLEDMKTNIKLKVKPAKDYMCIGYDGSKAFIANPNKIPENTFVTIPRPYSLSKFTLNELTTFIKILLAEMFSAGVDTKKFDQILQGMANDK